MSRPMDGFKVELPELERIASQDLPAVANALRAPATVLMAHEGLEGPGRNQAVYAMEGAYAHFTDCVALRKDKIPLLEPLPAVTNVAGADFSYDKFFNEARDPKTFSTQVEQQRAKLREQQNRPAGLIGQRLDGTR